MSKQMTSLSFATPDFMQLTACALARELKWYVAYLWICQTRARRAAAGRPVAEQIVQHTLKLMFANRAHWHRN